MSTTFKLDTSTSRANPTPQPMKRLTVPALRKRKKDGVTERPLVVLTANTARQAQLLDAHCDLLLVGDSLGQVIYGLPSTVPVTLEMMANHAAAVVRGSYHAVVAVDMPFGSYEASPAQAFESAAFLMKQSGAAAVKLEGGMPMADTVKFLVERGIPVIGHVGLTPQAVNVLDASFSFDGVIGAFALSNNMVVIALGLSIGAIFVRSMTIHLVHRGTLAEYAYLEHGAFWAILALAAIMLLSARYEIPESVTGLIGAVLIGFSLWWSIRANRREHAIG